MPFVISNPHASPCTSIISTDSCNRYRQKPRSSQRRNHRSRSNRTRLRPNSCPRATSLGDVLGDIVQYKYQNFLQKRSPGTKLLRPSATAAQLSKLPNTADRRRTISSSASFSFGSTRQRQSSASTSSSGAASSIFGLSGLSAGPSKQQPVIRSPIAESELSQAPSSPRFLKRSIDQGDIAMAASGAASKTSTARVAFGSVGSRTSGSSGRSYVNMGETTSPSVFLTGLSAQCVHTLYAGSFLVYGTNVAADWLHTYYACKGWSVTFPLRPWLTIWMVICCAVGCVCNFLLLYLCVENALRRKWEAEEFRNGCRLICQRLGHWITDFDCFRISFLILVFENAPMTFVNYWFISSCSVPRPGKIGWTFAFACAATILSVLWRGVMTFLAYKNLRCVKRRLPTPSGSNRSSNKRPQSSAAYFPLQQPPTSGAMTIGELQHQRLEAKISGSSSSTMEEIRSLASGDRTHHYDECWPVRMSCWVMYNQRDDVDPESPRATNSTNESSRPIGANLPAVRPPDNCLGYCCQASCCVCLCVLFYTGMFVTGCAPCAYHYGCRRNSRYHRNQFARTLTRTCSVAYNVFVVALTIFLGLSLLVLNLIWLSSVHLIGNTRTPPEISQICLFIDPASRVVHPTLMASIIPRDSRRPASTRIDCRPLFELNDQWGFWWQRSEPGPWLYQDIFQDAAPEWIPGPFYGSFFDQLAVKTETKIGRNANEATKIYAQFVHGMTNDCQYRVYENWTVALEMPFVELPWPYWTACDKAYAIEEMFGSCVKTKAS